MDKGSYIFDAFRIYQNLNRGTIEGVFNFCLNLIVYLLQYTLHCLLELRKLVTNLAYSLEETINYLDKKFEYIRSTK